MKTRADEPTAARPSPTPHPKTPSARNGSPPSSHHNSQLEVPQGVVLSKGKRTQLKTQHRSWVSELCRIIKSKSRCVLNRDGTVSHVLPTQIVKLVWHTTFKQRMEVERRREPTLDEKQADAKARAAIQAEMNDEVALAKAVEILKSVRLEQAKARVAKEEAKDPAPEQAST